MRSQNRLRVWRALRRFPLVRQYEQRDCGPAALLSILRYYGGRADLAYIRELCAADSRGTTMLNLIGAARTAGFNASGVAAGWESLNKINLPCIAHVIVKNNLSHYVIIRKLKSNFVFLSDPAEGSLKLKQNTFLKLWPSRALVLLEPAGRLLNKKPLHWLSWAGAFVKEQKTWLYQSIFLGLIYTLIGLFTAVFIRMLIDRFIPAGEANNILLTTAVLVSLFTLRAGAGYFRNRFLLILSRNISRDINGRFLEHLFRLPKNFFNSRRIGDITARLNDSVRIQQALLQVAGTSVIDILIICGSIVFMFIFSRLIGIIALCALPIYGLILAINAWRIKSRQVSVMQAFAQMESTYIDSLQGMDDIISFNAGTTFTSFNRDKHDWFQFMLYRLGLTRAKMVLLSEVAGMLLLMVVLCNGSLQVVNGFIQLGQFMAAYALVTNVLPAINRLTESSIGVQGASVAIKRLHDILLSSAEIKGTGPEMPPFRKLSLRAAKFKWPGGTRLFCDVNIQIQKGRITALCGASGSGKTTIADLLQRKYNLNTGQIYIGRKAAASIGLIPYREKIAIVPQDIKIFNGTIAENIFLGRKPPPGFDMSRWLATYRLGEFIEKFEGGLFTPVGEENRQLSAGEKKVVGFLRAMISEPELLIIDEGMCSLDFDIGDKIFELIRSYARHKAILIITHNYQTMCCTDYLYLLKNGKIHLEGKPLKVLQKYGFDINA